MKSINFYPRKKRRVEFKLKLRQNLQGLFLIQQFKAKSRMKFRKIKKKKNSNK